MNSEAITWLKTAQGIAWSRRAHKRVNFQGGIFADIKEDGLCCYRDPADGHVHDTCVDGCGRNKFKQDMYHTLSCTCLYCLSVDQMF